MLELRTWKEFKLVGSKEGGSKPFYPLADNVLLTSHASLLTPLSFLTYYIAHQSSPPFHSPNIQSLYNIVTNTLVSINNTATLKVKKKKYCHST